MEVIHISFKQDDNLSNNILIHVVNKPAAMAKQETQIPLTSNGLGYASSSKDNITGVSLAPRARNADELEVKLEFGYANRLSTLANRLGVVYI